MFSDYRIFSFGFYFCVVILSSQLFGADDTAGAGSVFFPQESQASSPQCCRSGGDFSISASISVKQPVSKSCSVWASGSGGWGSGQSGAGGQIIGGISIGGGSGGSGTPSDWSDYLDSKERQRKQAMACSPTCPQQKKMNDPALSPEYKEKLKKQCEEYNKALKDLKGGL